MSGRFVRQVRLPHHLSFAGYTTSRRRCYSALATARSAVASGADNDNEPVAGPSQTVADVHGSAIHISASEDKSHSDQNGPLHSDGQKGKKPSITPPSPPDAPRKPSNAELYLASLHAAGYEPTFEDLHRFRPPNGPPLSSSPRYSAEYNALADTLCRAFSKDQLRRFLQQWAKNSPFGQKNRRKRQYAESIIEEMWEWPKLKEVERAKQDRTEVSVRTFSVTPSELFLLLGKDGADLLDMSVAFNVHISLVSKPLGLRVEGIKAALKQISEHIGDVKKSIIEESVQLPTEAPIRPDMVQRISRLAGAFLQNSDDKGTVRTTSILPHELT
ncbi:hypothetical protein WOLCODRAFT_62495 [Wolfiporia cocos MD-104 SS10]|uniref:SLS1 N-terminal domain-containing protein n=1 Tax=Wolfiporia cocos (strain MD-104) TaxID=742152 RepID=A0A2H3IV24_WOLCO|nr:hypothetical protein WOLCODRAFT_62495 [Wolfiporia cocos MD-104 SS10]